MKAYDFDGVWNEGYQDKDGVIITGRSFEEFEETMAEKTGPEVPIYFNPQRKNAVTPATAGVWKAEMINKLGVTEFWEDDPIQAGLIKLLCPNTKVHLVKEEG